MKLVELFEKEKLPTVKTYEPSYIAKKHGVSKSVIEAQLKKGVKVEFEHTQDEVKAREIALDHLLEDPHYYDKLEKVEGK